MDKNPNDVSLDIRKSSKRILKSYLFVALACAVGMAGYVTKKFEDSASLPVVWLLLFGGAALLACIGAMISHALTRNFKVVLKSDRVDVQGGWRPAAWTFDRFCGPAWLEWDNQGSYYILKFRYFARPRVPQASSAAANERTNVGKIVLAYVPSEDGRRLLAELNARSEAWRMHTQRAAYEARMGTRKT